MIAMKAGARIAWIGSVASFAIGADGKSEERFDFPPKLEYLII
jgi:hypothetical protein